MTAEATAAKPAATQLPPGPRSPSLVHGLQWAFRPTQFMENCAERYGRFFTVRIPSMGTLVFVSDPDVLKDVFLGDPEIFRLGRANKTLEPVLGPQSLLTLDGKEHMRQRRLLSPPFHGDLERFETTILDLTHRNLEQWPHNQTFSLHPHMQTITLDVIMSAVLGIGSGRRYDRLRDLLKRLLATIGEPRAIALLMLTRPMPGPLTPWARIKRLLAEIDAELTAEIRERRQANTDGDVMSMLIAHEADGERLTERELRDELITLLIAGHETTATELTWAVQEVVHRPDVLHRVQSQDPEHRYLEAIINETLRLRPVLPITARELAIDYQVGDYMLPAGTLVVPCIYLVHRLADTYPEPHTFRPDRFLDATPDKHRWIPFGGGRRRCLGATFAQFEMRIILDAIFSSVTFAPTKDGPGRPRRRAITLAPAKGARVRVSSVDLHSHQSITDRLATTG